MSDAHDDEIEASRAPLLDHLVELRSRLIVCVVALVVGFFLCFAFVEPAYKLLLHPFYVAAQLVAVRAHHRERESGHHEPNLAQRPFAAATPEPVVAILGLEVLEHDR